MKVSVIIASYNRFDFLLEAISSVKKQTYKNIEIIVINDKSTDFSYYKNGDFKKGVIWIDLEENSKTKFGYACPGYVRDIGIKHSSGDLIAILDDDDYFLPEKISTQVDFILNNNASLVSTEAFIGFEMYNPKNRYQFYYKTYYSKFINTFFRKKYFWKNKSIPNLIEFSLISKHNFIIHSSVIFSKDLYFQVDGYDYIDINEFEDWMLFLKMLKYVDCHYLDIPLVYYYSRQNLNT